MANEMIAPERQGLFIVASFLIAVVALLLGLIGTYRNHALAVGTQVEILALSKKIKRLEARVGGGAETTTQRRSTHGDD